MDQYYPHFSWIEKQELSFLTIVEKWCAVHSGSDHLSGLAEMLDILKEAFAPLGGAAEAFQLPNKKELTLNGTFIENKLGKALVIRRHPNAPIRVLLAGHMDIAFSAHQKLGHCKRRSKDILSGRGTADMKGGLLVMLNALKALEESPFSGKIGWTVVITPDEEIGSPGSKDLLSRLAREHHLGLVFEPPLPDGTLVSARKGSMNYTAVVKGKQAHAGRDFYSGHNAVTAAARFVLAAESLCHAEEDITVNVGSFSGGGPLNIVPDEAICRLNIRARTLAEFNTLKEKIRRIAEIENQRGGIKLTLHLDTERPPKPFDKPTRELFELLKKCGSQLGIGLKWKATGGVCDGNILAAAGLKTIDTLGPVGGNLHTAEEYVSIKSVVQRSKLAARFLMQIAAGEVTIK